MNSMRIGDDRPLAAIEVERLRRMAEGRSMERRLEDAARALRLEAPEVEMPSDAARPHRYLPSRRPDGSSWRARGTLRSPTWAGARSSGRLRGAAPAPSDASEGDGLPSCPPSALNSEDEELSEWPSTDSGDDPPLIHLTTV